ncbi:UNVERIFIED_CONTAM: hypothetical protein FKN15_030631 [Acipenser sinensis]
MLTVSLNLNRERHRSNEATLCVDRVASMDTESRCRPKNSVCWLGTRRLLSGLTFRPSR